jgi:hypothetical protein
MDDVIEAIAEGLGVLPNTVLVMALLVGPTLAYIGYRLYAGPRAARSVESADQLFWICGECRSANEVRDQRCYQCKTHRDAVPGALRVIDEDQLLEIDLADPHAPVEARPVASPGVAVGPGKPVAPLPGPLVVPTTASELGERPPVALSIVPDPPAAKPRSRAKSKAGSTTRSAAKSAATSTTKPATKPSPKPSTKPASTPRRRPVAVPIVTDDPDLDEDDVIAASQVVVPVPRETRNRSTRQDAAG